MAEKDGRVEFLTTMKYIREIAVLLFYIGDMNEATVIQSAFQKGKIKECLKNHMMTDTFKLSLRSHILSQSLYRIGGREIHGYRRTVRKTP